MMRILVLDEEFPYPLNTGKRIRSFQLIRRLAEYHDVHYLAYGDRNSAGCRALEQAGMHPHVVPAAVPAKAGILFYGRLFLNLFSRYPYIVSSHYSRVFQAAVDRAVREIDPGLILCEWTPYARFVRRHSGRATLIVAHNIEAEIWQRYGEHETSPLRRWYISRQAVKVARFEQEAFRSVTGVIAVSDADAQRVHAVAPAVSVGIVENGVDLDYFDAPQEQETGRRLVFTGSMDWRPNQDAAAYFASEIFPGLLAKYPDIKLFVVGRNPPPHVQELGRVPGIIVTGTVEDVRPFIRQAAVYVVPLRVGGGSRLKILEALAMRKAVVSTTVGAEGLTVRHSQEVLLADTPEAFVAEVSRVLDNPELRRRLGQSGRKLVEDRYGWDIQADRLLEFVSSFARQG